MNNKGQASTASHVLLWVFVIAIGAWLAWSATHAVTNNDKFAPGATVSDNHSQRWPLTFDFNFSCVRQGLEDKWGGKFNVVATNSEVHH